MNRFLIAILTESGCNINEGEYSVFITAVLSGHVEIGRDGHLVLEAVEEKINELDLPDEGYTHFIAQERIEREDAFINNYYEILPPTTGGRDDDSA